MPDEGYDLKRAKFPDLLVEMNLLEAGAEVGVFEGWHAKLILDRWPGKLYAVDPHHNPDVHPGEPYNQEHVNDLTRPPHEIRPKSRWDRIRQNCVNALAPYGSRCEFWPVDSVTGAQATEDGSLDWVYIDGRHDYEGVLEDIQVWLPKAHQGGVLAGHDYLHHESIKSWPGVTQAVDECFGDKVKTLDTGLITTWYVLL